MGNMFGSTIQPQAPISFFNDAYAPGSTGSAPQQQELASALWGQAFTPGSTPGYAQFQGLPGYTGQINPDINPNLQNSWSNWQPWNAGNEYVASWLGGSTPGQKAGTSAMPGQVSPWVSSAQDAYAKYGGQGFPAQSLSAAIQFGAPSQAGQPISQTAQFGIPGQGGMPLAAYAQGGPTAASTYLQPFLSAKPYAAPTIG